MKTKASAPLCRMPHLLRFPHSAGREALVRNGDTKDARIHQLASEVALLREELRINGARMQRVAPHRRPQYTGVERIAILQLRAMRGWNKAETARHFCVSDDTVRAWLRRVDNDSLVPMQSRAVQKLIVPESHFSWRGCGW